MASYLYKFEKDYTTELVRVIIRAESNYSARLLLVATLERKYKHLGIKESKIKLSDVIFIGETIDADDNVYSIPSSIVI